MAHSFLHVKIRRHHASLRYQILGKDGHIWNGRWFSGAVKTCLWFLGTRYHSWTTCRRLLHFSQRLNLSNFVLHHVVIPKLDTNFVMSYIANSYLLSVWICGLICRVARNEVVIVIEILAWSTFISSFSILCTHSLFPLLPTMLNLLLFFCFSLLFEPDPLPQLN